MRQENPQLINEKIFQARKLMKREGIDTWLFLTRENSDPALPLLVGVRSVHQTAVFFTLHEVIVLTSVSDAGSYEDLGVFEQVRVYHQEMAGEFKTLIQELNPQRLALNISESDHLCDGLTSGLYLWLENTIGPETLTDIEVSSQEMLQELRSIKTTSEVELLTRSIRLTNEIYEAVFRNIICGMTEIEIGQLFVKEMKKHGVTNGLGAEDDLPLVCIVRKGLAHRTPKSYPTQPGDLVIIDFSLNYQGFRSDIARTCYFLKDGEESPPHEVLDAFAASYQAITTSVEALKPGKRGHEVDAAGRFVIEQAGYPTIRHSVGHQIGRATHDGGTILGPLSKGRPEVYGTVKVGEVYAIEPTVIQDEGKPCILVEENVLVTDRGAIYLSRRQQSPVLIPSKKETSYEVHP